MSEDTLDVVTETGNWTPQDSGSDDSAEPQFSEVEQKAMSMGWKPKDQFEGNPDDWRDAKEFVDRDSLYKKIHNQGREIRKVTESMQALIDHNKKMEQKLKETEKARLLAYKQAALEDNDYEAAVKYESEANALDEENTDIVFPEFDDKSLEEESPLFLQFKDRNGWYENNQEMTAIANTVAQNFALERQSAGQTYTEQEVYNYVESKMPDYFPSYFGKGTDKGAPGSLGNNNTRTGGEGNTRKSKYSFNDLNDMQKTVCKQFEDSGVMSRQEYIDQLAEIGELG